MLCCLVLVGIITDTRLPDLPAGVAAAVVVVVESPPAQQAGPWKR